MPCRRFAAGWAVSLALVGVLVSAQVEGRSQPQPNALQVNDPKPDDPLRVVAERKKLDVGACASPVSLRDPNGAAVLARHFNLLVAAFGTAPATPNWNPNADLDCNGVIDINDFSLLAGNYGLMGAP